MAAAAKGSRKLALGLLFIPFLYAIVLRCKVLPHDLWRIQFNRWESHSSTVSATVSSVYKGAERSLSTEFILRKLVRGKARRGLHEMGVACVSDTESDICITSNSVKIATATPTSPTAVYLTGGQQLPQGHANFFELRPYARKTDMLAMERTSPVRLTTDLSSSPDHCDVVHSVPAVVFSNGGFAGNFFHDINDVIIPLFLTAGRLRLSGLKIVVTDYEPWWTDKYRKVLLHLSSSEDIIVASSNSSFISPTVHCFPAAVVGLKYHGNLECNAADPPGGFTVRDFQRFLHASFFLDSSPITPSVVLQPTLVLISRQNSRVLLNEDEVVELLKDSGFKVELARPERMSNVKEFAELVNDCNVLIGVHGAGLTNMVFLRPRAVLLQVVPWGLDWASAVYYGRPAAKMGLQYVEYHTIVEESSLYNKYPRDHPVLADPWSINLQGYNVSKPVYTDGQNVTLDLVRFKETLLQARQLLSQTSLS